MKQSKTNLSSKVLSFRDRFGTILEEPPPRCVGIAESGYKMLCGKCQIEEGEFVQALAHAIRIVGIEPLRIDVHLPQGKAYQI